MKKLISAYKKFFKNYANFKSRSSRADYWLATAANAVVTAVIALLSLPATVAYSLGYDEGVIVTALSLLMILSCFISVIYALVTIVPSISLTIRRLHDTGKSALWLLVMIFPLAGSVLFLVFMLLSGDTETNKYGSTAI